MKSSIKHLVTLVLYLVSLALFALVDWKLCIAALSFGWAMNIENNTTRK